MKLKDKKINIYIERYVPNGNGYTTKVTEPLVLNVWAYFRQLSGKEIFAAAAYRYDEEVLFTINYRADLTIRYNKLRKFEKRSNPHCPQKRRDKVSVNW